MAMYFKESAIARLFTQDFEQTMAELNACHNLTQAALAAKDEERFTTLSHMIAQLNRTFQMGIPELVESSALSTASSGTRTHPATPNNSSLGLERASGANVREAAGLEPKSLHSLDSKTPDRFAVAAELMDLAACQRASSPDRFDAPSAQTPVDARRCKNRPTRSIRSVAGFQNLPDADWRKLRSKMRAYFHMHCPSVQEMPYKGTETCHGAELVQLKIKIREYALGLNSVLPTLQMTEMQATRLVREMWHNLHYGYRQRLKREALEAKRAEQGPAVALAAIA